MATKRIRATRVALAAACLLGVSGVVGASSFEYELDLPADRRLAYEIEFEVVHPGVLKMEATWSPARVLVFRLERPGHRDLRLSGPPPRTWELQVEADDIDRDTPWTLAISGLPSRDAAHGRLSIELPGPDPQPETRPAPPQTTVEPDPWTLPASIPGGANHAERRVFEATEAFRKGVVADKTPDAYGWRDEMLRFLAARRDVARASVLELSTRETLRRIVEAVRQLDRLGRSESEPLTGPAPAHGVSRRAWLAVRDPRFTPVEEELGSLLDGLYRGYTPELEDQSWFSSFLSCLIVCERHFEERARLGAERAANGELARAQWPHVLAAVEAMDALVAISPGPEQQAGK